VRDGGLADEHLIVAAAAQDATLEPEELVRVAAAIEAAVGAVVIGQREAVRGVLLCLLAGGHALLEGVPGLGKTTLAATFAAAIGLDQRRIQFTPDLLPADITGTTILTRDGGATDLRFRPGPLFAHVVVADEINRAAPRTQSALLEAMQERAVTVAETTHALPDPFCVLATQNPVELQGTYPLPEAELDRFLLRLEFVYPTRDELNELVGRTETAPVASVTDAETLRAMRDLVRSVPAASHVADYATRLVLALQPDGDDASPLVRSAVRLGPSPRGALALGMAGRAAALLDGRHSLAFEDVRAVAHAALRHRIGLSFEAEREGVSAGALVDDALARVPEEI
jgi:MoxR-like ATPase